MLVNNTLLKFSANHSNWVCLLLSFSDPDWHRHVRNVNTKEEVFTARSRRERQEAQTKHSEGEALNEAFIPQTKVIVKGALSQHLKPGRDTQEEKIILLAFSPLTFSILLHPFIPYRREACMCYWLKSVSSTESGFSWTVRCSLPHPEGLSGDHQAVWFAWHNEKHTLLHVTVSYMTDITNPSPLPSSLLWRNTCYSRLEGAAK